MREIKFRGWDVKNHVMFEEVYPSRDNDVLAYLKAGDRLASYLDGRVELMQYTGLKDKNGTEIYEGDIILSSNGYKHCDAKTVVQFENGRFIYGQQIGWNDGTTTTHEVIGNIYDNPELLEKGK